MSLLSSRRLLVYGVLLVCQIRLVKSNAYVYNASQVLPNTPWAVDVGAVPKPAKWDTYVERGLDSYWAWKQATDDKAEPDQVPDDVFEITLRTMSEIYFSGIMQTLGKSVDPALYTSVDAQWLPSDFCPPAPGPVRVESALFMDYASAHQGVFVAFHNHRDRSLPEEYSFARVAFWMWQKIVERDLPTVDLAPLSRLEYFVRLWIGNDDTRDTIQYALALVKAEPGDTIFVVEEPPSNEEEELDLVKQAFWALVATPKGKAVIRLLVEHKASMQGNHLESVTVRWIDNGGPILDTYHIWGKYAESP